MKFQVYLTERADNDLRNIFLYIAVDLHSPENAKKQLSRLWERIKSLDEMPERYRRYEEEPWLSRGLHILPVDHYVVLYIPDLENKTVQIVRVMYGGRDISEQLNNM